MQDEAVPHYVRHVIRRHLNNVLVNRWIGRGWDAPQPWPPRNPDLNLLLDSFISGTLLVKCTIIHFANFEENGTF